MKKVVSCLFTCALAIMMSISSVFATSYDEKINIAYANAKSYYENNTLNNESYFLDQILIAEILNVNNYKSEDITNLNFEELTPGKLSKVILSLVLMKKNPQDIKNMNLIALLNSYIQQDGKIEKNKIESDAADMAWVIYALVAVNSENKELVADKLSNMNNPNDGGFMTYGSSNPDVTGYCIEALSIVNKEKYSESINKGITYLNDMQQDDAHWTDAWQTPANTNTQSNVLRGLLVYDKEAVINGNYNKSEMSPFDVIMNNQNSKGYFGWSSKEADDWNSQDFATVEALMMLYTYKNGSFVYKVQNAYNELITNLKENKPIEQLPTQTETTVTNTETRSVKTGDSTDGMLFMSAAIISGGLYLLLGKEYERAN